MDVKGVDANLLAPLEALLTEASLTRAAERLGLTQPGMSGALARLRQHFGDPLLVRAGRGYELTPKAVALLPAVREATDAVTRVLQARPGFDPSTSRREFVIAASDFGLSVVTGPLLERTRIAAPGVGLDFRPLPASGPVEPGDLQRCDVIIAGSDRGVPGRRVEVFRDRFVVVVDATNPAVEDGRLPLDRLAALPHVAASFGATNSTPVDDMLAARGIEARVAVTCRGFLPVPHLVRGTTRVGIVPERVAARAGGALGVVVVDTDLPATDLVEVAHWHPAASSDVGLQWLLQQLGGLDPGPTRRDG